MKKLAIAVTAVAALTGSALAADMSVKAPAAPVVRAVSWTGCYVGAGFGYGMWNQETYRQTDPAFVQFSPSATTGGRGWFGTVQGGCDYQVASSWVIGAFADYDFGSIKGNYNLPTSAFYGEEKQTSAWSAGGRIGYLPMERLMAFVSGGYTQARFNQIDFFAGFPPVPNGLNFAAHTYSGFFLGSGYEYALGFMPGLFWKTEYRFAAYRADNLSLLNTAGVPQGEGINSKKYEQTIRSELVYRFNFH